MYYRMKRGSMLDGDKEEAMRRVVENPPPRDFVAADANPKRGNRGVKIQEEVKQARLKEIRTFLDYVEKVYSYASVYDTLTKTAELLGVQYLTAYTWHKGTNTPRKETLLKAKAIMNGPDKLERRDNVTLDEFLAWLSQRYGCTKKSHAIEKAASLFHVGPATIWGWLRNNTPLKRSIREEIAFMMAGTVLNKANHKVVIYLSPEDMGLPYMEFAEKNKMIKDNVEKLLKQGQQVTLIPFNREEYESFLERRGIPDNWESRREWGKQY